MAAMIRHCDALFGSHFGGDTARTQQAQTPKLRQSQRMLSDQSWSNKDRLISAMPYPSGTENQSTGPGSLNTQSAHPDSANPQQQHLKQGYTRKQLAPLDVQSPSSHSSDSTRSMRGRQYGRQHSGSAPSSPNKRALSSFGRASREQPWMPGKSSAQAEKALQKHKVRYSKHIGQEAHLGHNERTLWCCHLAYLRCSGALVSNNVPMSS